MPGPLPDPNRVRRNAPTIPTTNLPVGGFVGEVPEVPDPCELSKAGLSWWAWAWRTPQAAAWDAGSHQIIARRASLEDDLAALHDVEGLDFLDLADSTQASIKFAVARVAAMATGRLAITREMRELDDRLGLSPKGLSALRWTIVAEATEQAPVKTPDEVAARRGRRERLASGE